MIIRPVILTLLCLVGTSLAQTVAVPYPPQPAQSLNRLHLTGESVSPGFKLLLFPHVEGQTVPMTKWNAARDTVSIGWVDQTDHLHLAIGNDGRTRVEIRREGG